MQEEQEETNNKQEEKKEKKKSLLVFGLLVLFIIGLGIFIMLKPDKMPKRDLNTMMLAKCISSKNVMLYFMEGCQYCAAQKEWFGEGFEYLLKVNCSEDMQSCIDLNISAVPAWLFPDGTMSVGALPLEILANFTGCAQ